MRLVPKAAKRRRLSKRYGHYDAGLPAKLVLNDPFRTPNVVIAHRVLAKDLRRCRKSLRVGQSSPAD
jgi:hypothetical protein